ncbi:MAG: hypothetical protein MI919_23960 [Holophagales bacterium]|nr:hypothetical protein [Holophagales bacterium]
MLQQQTLGGLAPLPADLSTLQVGQRLVESTDGQQYFFQDVLEGGFLLLRQGGPRSGVEMLYDPATQAYTPAPADSGSGIGSDLDEEEGEIGGDLDADMTPGDADMHTGEEAAPPRAGGKRRPEARSFSQGDRVLFESEYYFGAGWRKGYIHRILGDGRYEIKGDRNSFEQEVIGAGNAVRVRAESLQPDTELAPRKKRATKKSGLKDAAAEVEQARAWSRYASITPLLLRHPLLFGWLLEHGGRVGTDAVKALAERTGVGRLEIPMVRKHVGAPPEEKGDAFVYTDTTALLATRLDELGDRGRGIGPWRVYPRQVTAQQGPVDENALGAEERTALTRFQDRFLFRQGRADAEALMNIPAVQGRNQMHAEAKAVRSQTWDRILRETIAELRGQLPLGVQAGAVSAPPEAEPARRESPEKGPARESQAKAEAPPIRRKIISIVINRSSCGKKGGKGGSGYGGGCAQEVADAIRDFWTALGKALGADLVQRLRQEQRIVIEVSAAGRYSEEGMLSKIAEAGGRVTLHPTFDFEKGQPNPITAGRLGYLRELEAMNRAAAKGDPALLAAILKSLESALGGAQLGATRAQAQARHRVTAAQGQETTVGATQPAHIGRIACTAIAARALGEIFARGPGTLGLTQDDLVRLMRQGIDIDYQARRALPGAQPAQAPSLRAPPQSPAATQVTPMDEGGDERPSTEQVKPPASLAPPTLAAQAPAGEPKAAAQTSAPTATQTGAKLGKAASGRHFRPDEITETREGALRITRNRLLQQQLTAENPTQLYGARGDYRRLTRMLMRQGPGNGFLVTIGGATLAIALVTAPPPGPAAIGLPLRPVFVLFDSHGRARLELYASEQALADRLDEMYPYTPLPEGEGGEMLNVWAAVPYQPGPPAPAAPQPGGLPPGPPPGALPPPAPRPPVPQDPSET